MHFGRLAMCANILCFLLTVHIAGYFIANQTTQDDIEARICSYEKYEHGSILIDQLELYIQ